MKKFIIICVTFFSLASFSEEQKELTNKKWYFGIGPIFTGAMPVGSGGTKYNINVAFNQGISERINLLYMYDGNFNSAAQGSTAITTIGAGIHFLTKDRGASTSPFISLDTGYGGSNAYIQAAWIVGGGAGLEFFRNNDYSIEIAYRHMRVLTRTVSSMADFPAVNQLRIGVYF